MFRFAGIILVALISLTTASIKDDMTALEKDLGNAHLQSAAKKSLSDLSTDELIDELKKEVDAVKREHHDAFRSRFSGIVNKKAIVSKDAFKSNSAADDQKLWERSLSLMTDEILKRFTEGVTCKDERTDCHRLKSYCESHRTKLEKGCAKTCKYCTVCEDKMKRGCDKLKDLNQCDQQRGRMMNYCPKTCGFCKAPAPPKCSKTKYGCCWNKETIKTNENGDNCPRCLDQYQYVCDTFKTDCTGLDTAGDFMRYYCPNTCKLCSSDCQDAATKSFYCPFWKKDLKWCEFKKEIMRHFCPKTCGFC